MFLNYLKIAFRNLLRHKLYSFINIGGLSIGLAACLLIALFVRNEASYDTWLADADRLFRLEATKSEPGKPILQWARSPGPLHNVLAHEQESLIEASSRMLRRQSWVGVEDLNLEETINFVDPGFFDVFDLPIVAGDRSQMFNDYQSLVISEKAARKYFGEENAIGRTLKLDYTDQPAKIVAVMKDLPTNSHLNVDFLLHLNEARFDGRPFLLKWWMSSNVFTYVKLFDANRKSTLEASLPALLDRHALTAPGVGYTEGIAPSNQLSIQLMPVKDIHLHSKGRGQQKPVGDIVVVYSFSAIAALILAIAMINFANLSTARSSTRAREVALRKTLGASRKQVTLQFLMETALTTFIALTIAMTLVEILLPWFNELISKLLSMDSFRDPGVQVGLVGLAVILTIGAGAHPALSMSAYRPASVLHSNNAARYRTSRIRSVLTMLQFTIAIGLMITTAVIYNQINYMQSMELGIDTENKLTLFHMTDENVGPVAEAVRREIEALPEVKGASYTNRSFPIRGHWDLPAQLVGAPNAAPGLRLERIVGDHDALQFFGADLLAGRFFAEEYRTDLLQPATGSGSATQGGILNERAARQLGFASPDQAIGQVVNITQSDDSVVATRIVGVVADIQLRSARESIDPMVFLVQEAPLWILNVDIREGMEADALSQIDAIWDTMVPAVPLDRNFVDERYNAYYAADRQRGEIFAYFSVLAIFISCLGLYGLASFTAERRIKEIGVRKVLGASVTDIVRLLTFQFSKPVLLANLIAWPVAWYVSTSWLEGFEFRIDLGVSYFLVAGALAMLIACATVAGHAVRTARANPVTALKHE